MKYTIGKEITQNDYHHPIIRTTLTRNLASLFPDIADEMQASFKDILGSSGGMNRRLLCSVVLLYVPIDWRTIVPHAKFMNIICRTTNRVFVGAPLCIFHLSSFSK